MGFEKRGNQRYYYRKKRRPDGTVFSEYCGHGKLARLLAELDASARDKNNQKQQRFEAKQHRENEVDGQLDELGHVVKAVTEACLIVAGYHQHKRQWRKWRKTPR